MHEDDVNSKNIGALIAEGDRQREEAEAIDKMCLPYVTQEGPYSLETSREAFKRVVDRIIRSKYEAGKILYRVRNHEQIPTWERFLEEFSVPKTTAWRWMRFGFFCANSQRFRKFFDQPGMMRKALALLEGLGDPEVIAELTKYEATGELLGRKEAEIQKNSVRELQREVRRLRKEKAEAIEKVEQEKDRLQKKIEALEVDSGASGLKESLKLLSQTETQITEGMATLAKADCELLAKDAGAVAKARLLIDKMRRVADFIEGSFFSAAKARMEAQG